MRVDVFNGDADGICALVQLRLAEPAEAELITGIKREIDLLKRVNVNTGDQVTVLDISLDKNRPYLNEILASGAEVFYVDHHHPGDIPQHPSLTTLIDTDAAVCTSLLVNKHLQGRYAEWAVTAAFGDNLNDSAGKLATSLGLSEDSMEQLKMLGICINYNGYGSSIADLQFAPDRLYTELRPFASPFEFIKENAEIHQQLLDGYTADMAEAMSISPEFKNDNVAVYLLPDANWARRVSGVFGNHLANLAPDNAHAVISHNKQGGYLISVRAPLTNKIGADELCGAFPTGGGRKAAAGINHLPKAELNRFISAFADKYKQS